MNFFQAMEALKTGKKVRHKSYDERVYVIYESPYIYQMHTEEPDKFIHIVNNLYIYSQDWEIVEDKPKPNGLGLLSDSMIITIHDKTKTIVNSISNAILIYMKLLSHPLVAKYNDGKVQSIIDFKHDYNIDIYTAIMDGLKRISLSPIFETSEDARQAIKDIGEDNLIFMFKVLKGIE